MDLKPVTGNEPSSFISSNAEASESGNEGPEVEVAVVDVADSEMQIAEGKKGKQEEHQLLNQ